MKYYLRIQNVPQRKQHFNITKVNLLALLGNNHFLIFVGNSQIQEEMLLTVKTGGGLS